MTDALIWNGMTQAELDAAYNNMAAVANSGTRLADWTERSARLRARLGDKLEIAYGPRPRNRIDIFRCGRSAAPLVVFIHGGWWQRNSKEVFACVAEGPLAHGLDVALVGYTLAPDASLGEIAAEVWTALDSIVAHQAQRGGATRLVLSGWSAGGHLTALSMGHPAVAVGVSISGVFDLEPIRLSYINEKLRLMADAVLPLSPAQTTPTEKPLTLAFGLAELPEMQRQSVDYAAHAGRLGKPVTCLPLAGHDHFSIVEELARPDGRLTRLCVAQAEQARNHLHGLDCTSL
jgi:acetyl esterase/lipase